MLPNSKQATAPFYNEHDIENMYYTCYHNSTLNSDDSWVVIPSDTTWDSSHNYTALSLHLSSSFSSQLLLGLLRSAWIIPGSSVDKICGIDMPPETTISAETKDGNEIYLHAKVKMCIRMILPRPSSSIESHGPRYSYYN